MATQAINQWMLDDLKTEQAYKDAELATRIIEAFAAVPEVNLNPRALATYHAALRTMQLYLTHEVKVK